MDDLGDLRRKILDRIVQAGDESALEDLRVSAVGKKGEVSLKMRELGKMTPEQRQVAGPALNALKERRAVVMVQRLRQTQREPVLEVAEHSPDEAVPLIRDVLRAGREIGPGGEARARLVARIDGPRPADQHEQHECW